MQWGWLVADADAAAAAAAAAGVVAVAAASGVWTALLFYIFLLKFILIVEKQNFLNF